MPNSTNALRDRDGRAPRPRRTSHAPFLVPAFALFAAFCAALGAFGACAQGSALPGTGGQGGEGKGGSGPVPGELGSPCANEQDCLNGADCKQVGDAKICTFSCPPQCPEGAYCALVEGDPVCLPDNGKQCALCNQASECGMPSAVCLTAPKGDKFCARDCTTMSDCPLGLICMDKATYESPPDTGEGGGQSGTAGGGPSFPDAGSKPPAGIASKFCVPPSGDSCPCNDKRDGVSRSCSVENGFGTCLGTETCNGDDAKWEGCSADTPEVEICDGNDQNCDGVADDGDGNALCGGKPEHADFACVAGECAIGACEPGWAAYPEGPADQGCTCPTDPGEPNDTCASATPAGSVTDTGPGIEIQGTLSAENDVDVWAVTTVDADEVIVNTYHVSVDLIAPAASDEFELDVIRGACTDAPTGGATGITSYDWCVDGKSADGTAGEVTCGPTDPVHCENHSSAYFIRVRRRAGKTGTCATYKVAVTANGEDPCDFTATCN